MKSKTLEITGGISLNPLSHELIFEYDGCQEIVRLEPLTVRLLMALIHGKESIVTREQLISEIWDSNEGVGNKALTKNIYKLRKEFEKQGFDGLIETVPKKGYRLRVSSLVKKKPTMKKRRWLIAAAVVIFVIVKVLAPDLFHSLSHPIMH